MDNINIKVVDASDLLRYINDIARLRIEVFRTFPYLYDGDIDYEKDYLRKYNTAAGAVCVLALEHNRVVGASTGLPMVHEAHGVQSPFLEAGYDVRKIFYFGESVLLRSYRGRGIGHAFFDHREAHALTLPGIEMTAFCAVDRPDDHPLKDADYRSLDQFWIKRGYTKQAHMKAHMSWLDINESEETTKQLTFWTKSLIANG